VRVGGVRCRCNRTIVGGRREERWEGCGGRWRVAEGGEGDRGLGGEWVWREGARGRRAIGDCRGIKRMGREIGVMKLRGGGVPM